MVPHHNYAVPYANLLTKMHTCVCPCLFDQEQQ